MAEKVTSLQEIRSRIPGIQTELANFGVHSLAVFGSFSREEMTDSSDVDILVEFNRSIGLFEFARLKIFLSEVLGRDIDLVTIDALRDSMKPSILKEAIHVT